MARKVAKSLEDANNRAARGHNMYMKRKQKSEKWSTGYDHEFMQGTPHPSPFSPAPTPLPKVKRCNLALSGYLQTSADSILPAWKNLKTLKRRTISGKHTGSVINPVLFRSLFISSQALDILETQ